MELIVTTTTEVVLTDGTKAAVFQTTTKKTAGDNPRFYCEEAEKALRMAESEHRQVVFGGLASKQA
jgi:hypothetical protein